VVYLGKAADAPRAARWEKITPKGAKGGGNAPLIYVIKMFGKYFPTPRYQPQNLIDNGKPL